MRKKILLINPGHEDRYEPYKHSSFRTIHRDPPPIGILSVGTYLDANGYEVHLIDTHVVENYPALIEKRILENDYLFVGFTVIIGKFIKNSSELTELIKGLRPALPIVWGGICASVFHDEMMRAYPVDYIVRYEGEEIALNLARALEGKFAMTEIMGVTYRKGDKIVINPAHNPTRNLDEYPVLKWELLGEHFNIDQRPYYYLIMSSRDCPYNCSFCYKHTVDIDVRNAMPNWRARSAQHVIEEVEYIHEKTGTTVFTFGDDNFFVSKDRALEILAHFRKRGFYIEECIGHLSCLNDKVIEAMGGIVQTFIFSVETASQRLHKQYIRKGLKIDDVPVKLEKLYQQGIVSPLSFIVGLPTETMDDLQENVDFMVRMKEINPFVRGNAYLFLPLPRTALYTETEKLYNVSLDKPITAYEDANFWVRGVDDPWGKKFRPWLSDEHFKFLVHYGIVFNDVFRMCNRELSSDTARLLETHKPLRDMFGDLSRINRPAHDYNPYLLDRVLRNEKIDLKNDLKNHVGYHSSAQNAPSEFFWSCA